MKIMKRILLSFLLLLIARSTMGNDGAVPGFIVDCSGNDRAVKRQEAVSECFHQNGKGLNTLYQAALHDDPTINGFIKLAFEVGANQRVASVEVAETDIKSATLLSNYKAFVKLMRFPPQSVGGMETHTIHLYRNERDIPDGVKINSYDSHVGLTPISLGPPQLDEDNCATAQDFLQKVVRQEKDPDTVMRALYFLAKAYAKCGDAKRSTETLITLVEKYSDGPFNSEAYLRIGCAFLTLKNYDDSLKYFEIAEETASSGFIHSNSVSGSGWSLLRLGRYREAVSKFALLRRLPSSEFPDETIEAGMKNQAAKGSVGAVMLSCRKSASEGYAIYTQLAAQSSPEIPKEIISGEINQCMASPPVEECICAKQIFDKK